MKPGEELFTKGGEIIACREGDGSDTREVLTKKLSRLYPDANPLAAFPQYREKFGAPSRYFRETIAAKAYKLDLAWNRSLASPFQAEAMIRSSRSSCARLIVCASWIIGSRS